MAGMEQQNVWVLETNVSAHLFDFRISRKCVSNRLSHAGRERKGTLCERFEVCMNFGEILVVLQWVLLLSSVDDLGLWKTMCNHL